LEGLSNQLNREKILILCVDKDDDIGVKGGLKTPILGRSENIQAASQLALVDPEEPDANAIFGAVRLFDTLSKQIDEEEFQIATIAGSQSSGVEADRRIGEQLQIILKTFPAKGIIFVSDGFADETLIPIIQSHAPILSIRRIVVKHSEAIEESAALISRYARSILEDPYYSKWLLGVPGILLIILGILWYLSILFPGIDLPVYGPILLLVFLGVALLVKGFGFDRRTSGFSRPPNLVRWFATLATVVLLGVAINQTYAGLSTTIGPIDLWQSQFPQVIGYTIVYSIDFLIVAACTLLVGWGVYFFFERDQRMWYQIVGIVVSIWLREVALKASAILISPLSPGGFTDILITDLLFVVGLGIATTIITVVITLALGRRYESYFESRKKT
jgi:putative membrane protein